MAELRLISTRATISPAGFVNEYHWGDLKGDPQEWMRRYFDAFVYSANWRTCRLVLRLPSKTLRRSDVAPFQTQTSLNCEETRSGLVIDWSLEEGGDDERFCMEDGPGWMDRLLPVRDELLRGDLRALYLGWLAGVSMGDDDDDALEPAVPAGLSRLTAAQQALAAFLEIDPDLLAAAAAGSAGQDAGLDDDSVEAWIAGLPKKEMRLVFNMLLHGESQQAERRVKSAFRVWRNESGSGEPGNPGQRSVADLRVLAKQAEAVRMKQQADEQLRRNEAARKQRDAYLHSVADNAEQCWSDMEQKALRATASSYDAVKRTMADLADAYALRGNMDDYHRLLRAFVDRHGKRAPLMQRLMSAGLWSRPTR
nr:hypothetical protein [Massilia mucilaginosa]